jgi:hypothetical protein
MKIKTLPFYFCVILLGCKSTTQNPASPEQPLMEPANIPEPSQKPVEDKPSHVSSQTAEDLCETHPDVYKRKDGECVLIPRPSVEGVLNITSGVIWQPDLTRCSRPWSNGSFRFCSGGVHATIPLPTPEQGNGKVRLTLRFKCNSVPTQNALSLTIGEDNKSTLASVLTDDPVFSSEIPVTSGIAKSVRLDFTPLYDATYPPSCRIILVENVLVQSS